MTTTEGFVFYNKTFLYGML